MAERASQGRGGRSRRQDAYELILAAIVFGDLAPGSVIDEKQLTRTFDTGLASVRDALARLALEGMIERHARIGTRVPDLGLRELQEVFEARVLLEGACAGLAAERASAAEIAALRAAFEGYERVIAARDFRNLVTRDQAFHRTLAAACRNSPIQRSLVLLHNNASRFWYFGIQRLNTGALTADIQAHLDVVDAIEERDAAEAERLMRTVLGHFPDYMRDVLIGSPFLGERASSAQTLREARRVGA